MRPAELVKSRPSVRTGNRHRVGEIVQDNVLGKIRLTDADGRNLRQIRAENWRAWGFGIVNRDWREVAGIDKRFVGVLTAVFTTADTLRRAHRPPRSTVTSGCWCSRPPPRSTPPSSRPSDASTSPTSLTSSGSADPPRGRLAPATTQDLAALHTDVPQLDGPAALIERMRS